MAHRGKWKTMSTSVPRYKIVATRRMRKNYEAADRSTLDFRYSYALITMSKLIFWFGGMVIPQNSKGNMGNKITHLTTVYSARKRTVLLAPNIMSMLA
jgi:hypothetical protein